MKWLKAHWFQVAVVALLALIYLQGSRVSLRSLRDTFDDVSRSVRAIGKPEETVAAPPPGSGPSGIERLYGDRIEEAFQRDLAAQRAGASSPR
jgi:hypothetical protein